MTTGGGWVSHTTRGNDREYQAKLRAAKQMRPNAAIEGAYLEGAASTYREGVMNPVKDSMSRYGAPTIMPGDLANGNTGHFSQRDEPGNIISNNVGGIMNTSGNADLQTSAGKTPHEAPAEFEFSALDRKMAEATGRLPQGSSNLNNIQTLYGLG